MNTPQEKQRWNHANLSIFQIRATAKIEYQYWMNTLKYTHQVENEKQRQAALATPKLCDKSPLLPHKKNEQKIRLQK